MCSYTTLCNLSLIACFLALMFHKVVWQHVQDVVGFLINQFTANLPGFPLRKKWKSVKIWQNYSHEFVASLFGVVSWDLVKDWTTFVQRSTNMCLLIKQYRVCQKSRTTLKLHISHKFGVRIKQKYGNRGYALGSQIPWNQLSAFIHCAQNLNKSLTSNVLSFINKHDAFKVLATENRYL